ncbi:MAG: NADPH-dependent 7-cyano-7-deazaguanine reductase QueF [Gammaproteobacteria bacterium]|nr:NADPH-dependent 7-cyano-7-deazaguanine reductase QueF [Gammaproteobacteria bacterium]MBT8110161.1 NADPH-dependent 7-cyano-7-deazaguanine reductase QueF [Gammaproteobacteria bacterium]NNL44864.1 NADPH-dependent 7-cyano-7-deazaguanine reductase QueF [Woeseiaceae bacterium]
MRGKAGHFTQDWPNSRQSCGKIPSSGRPQATITRLPGANFLNDRKVTLGQETGYPDKYAPELLYPISRTDSRNALGVAEALPFSGMDIWNAWELTWLGEGDLPAVATAEIAVPADTPCIVESKSLKLYLNSFSMSQFPSSLEVAATVASDLSACAGGRVRVKVRLVGDTEARRVSRLAGSCLDSISVNCTDWEVDADLLQANSDELVDEDLHTHLLRSLCPVTSQPDIGSLQVSYRGPKIDRGSLLRYIVSYRQHNDFHEACVERMFVDLMSHCAPEKLSIHARYQRRGGIDINPYRSNSDERPVNLRLWRQ